MERGASREHAEPTLDVHTASVPFISTPQACGVATTPSCRPRTPARLKLLAHLHDARLLVSRKLRNFVLLACVGSAQARRPPRCCSTHEPALAGLCHAWLTGARPALHKAVTSRRIAKKQHCRTGWTRSRPRRLPLETHKLKFCMQAGSRAECQHLLCVPEQAPAKQEPKEEGARAAGHFLPP